MKCKHFPCYSASPMDSPRKGQWLGALMFFFICARTNDLANNCDAGDLRRHRGHYHVTVMKMHQKIISFHEIWFIVAKSSWNGRNSGAVHHSYITSLSQLDGKQYYVYWHRTRVIAVYMMTSSNGNIFRVTGPLCGEFTGPGEFPAQRPVTRSFDVFFDLCLNKRLSKQWWGWWFVTLSWSLWRQCNVHWYGWWIHGSFVITA